METLEDINRYQRQLIVHSYIYYYLNDNLWDDHKYDTKSNQLVQLKHNNPEWINSQFSDIFKDFDGSTGYQLIRRDLEDYHDHFMRVSQQLLNKSIKGNNIRP